MKTFWLRVVCMHWGRTANYRGSQWSLPTSKMHDSSQSCRWKTCQTSLSPPRSTSLSACHTFSPTWGHDWRSKSPVMPLHVCCQQYSPRVHDDIKKMMITCSCIVHWNNTNHGHYSGCTSPLYLPISCFCTCNVLYITTHTHTHTRTHTDGKSGERIPWQLQAAGGLLWLTDAEKKAYAEWKPCALPQTCEAEIPNHQVYKWHYPHYS